MSEQREKDICATLLGSASCVFEELTKGRSADRSRLGMHLLGVAICLEHWPRDPFAENRRRAAQQLKIIALEVREPRYRASGDLEDRIRDLLRAILSGEQRNT